MALFKYACVLKGELYHIYLDIYYTYSYDLSQQPKEPYFGNVWQTLLVK